MIRIVLFLLAIVIGVVSYAQQDNSIMPDSVGVEEFMERMMQRDMSQPNGHMISVFEWRGAGKWVKEKDIELLMKYVNSQQRCACIAHALSSTLPDTNEYATIGGIAMDLIDYYRGKMGLPGRTSITPELGEREYSVWYRCPKTEEKRVAEINAWWATKR